MAGTIDWQKIRSDFPVTERFAYLDHASASPIPRPVFERGKRYYEELAGFCDVSWNRWIEERKEVRAKAAVYMKAEPHEIAFTSNTSHGMNLIADLISKKGPILTNTLEFPATTIPWLYRKAKVKFLKPVNGRITPELIRKNLAGIKTILISFVQYQNGFKADLEAIGKIKGNRFLVVNGTQGFGYMPIDVKKAKIDFFATNSYKWLMAGYGGGLLFIDEKWLTKLKPLAAGWRSVPNPDVFNNQDAKIKTDASRYELGSPPFPSIFSIGAALDYFNAIGTEQIWQRIKGLTDHAIEELQKDGFEILTPLDSESRSGIVVFKVKNHQKVTNQLLMRRFYVSARGGGIRIAPHIYNTEEEIDRFLAALREEVVRA